MPIEHESKPQPQGFWERFYSTAKVSLSEVWEETVEQAHAIPAFFHSLIANKETRNVVSNTALVVATDIVPILAVHAAYNMLENQLLAEESPAFALTLCLTLLRYLRNAFTFRQTLEALVRIGVLQAKQASIFDNATRETRHHLEDKVCEDCSTLRFIKGSARSMLVYVAQQGVGFCLDKLAGGYLVVGGYDVVVDSYSSQVLGQLILDYRLANEGLCERHRHIYTQQFWERVFALGLPVVVIRKLLTALIEGYTGVDSCYYGGMIESLLSIFMVGFAHHLRLPEPPKNTERWPDGATMVRAVTAYGMDKLAPDTVELVKRLMDKHGEPFPLRRTYKMVVQVYKDPKTQAVMCLILPKMFLSAQRFVDDEVVRDYWPPIRKGLINDITTIQTYQPKLVDGPFSYVPSWMTHPVIAYVAGVPKGAVDRAVKLLKDPEVMGLLDDLKTGITRLEVDMDHKSVMAKIVDSVVPAWMKPRAFTPPALIQDYVAPPSTIPVADSSTTSESKIADFQSEERGYESATIVQATKQGLNAYLAKFTTGRQSFWSGQEGQLRAQFYLQMLNTHTTCEAHSLLVCWALLQNTKGNTLLRKVLVALHQVLPPSMRVASIDDLEPLRQRLISSLLTKALSELHLTNRSSIIRQLNQWQQALTHFANASPQDATKLDVSCKGFLDALPGQWMEDTSALKLAAAFE